MKVLVVEDEMVHQEQMKVICADLGWDILEIVDNGYDALSASLRYKPELILLDVGLKEDVNGVTLAEQISKLHQAMILFTTSNTDPEVLNSESVRKADGYLIKPIHAQQLKASVDIAKIKKNGSNSEKKLTTIALKRGTGSDIVPLVDLYSISTSGNRYCRYRCANRHYRIRITLSEAESQLPADDFIRIHKSHLIRIEAIQSLIGSDKVLMKDGETLPISESKRDQLQRALLG